MKFTLSLAKVNGQASNKSYPDITAVTDKETLLAAVRCDHVCGTFKHHQRSRKNFLSADCIVMDCDNDHSDDPAAWISPSDCDSLFPDISCAIVPSRNHMKPKNGKAARPRFHVYFPIAEIDNEEIYADLKHKVQLSFPFFDANALDSARFIFGNSDVTSDSIIWQEGSLTVHEYIVLMADNGTDMIPAGSRNSTLSHFAGRILKKLGNTKEARAAFLSEADKCKPPLDRAELRIIWQSALRFYKTVSKQPGYVKPEEYAAPDWADPIPFSKVAMDRFPVDALPTPLADYVAAVAESTQTPVDMAGTVALAILSTCLQGKYRIQCKADWIEPLNTYSLVIAAPSERKSAVTHMMIRPVNNYEIQYNQQNAALVEASKMQRKVLERRQKALIDNIAKGKATQADLDQLAQEIADYDDIKPMQLYVDDITPEKLVSVLSANNGKAALISTEGGIFDTLAGTYSKVVNIDVMLKGYSGDTIRVDRIGRDSEYVMDPALTILLMAQPNVVATVLSNTTFRGRGLTARFLYCMPVSNVGKRKYHSSTVSEDISTAYDKKVLNLLQDDSRGELITLSPEADKLISDYAEELEPLLTTKYAEMADWCGKLVGNTLRIAGLLCRAETDQCLDFLDVSEPLVVSEETMKNAIRLSRYYLNHAQAAYSVLPENDMYKQAEKILEAICNKKLVSFDRRDMMRMCRSFRTVADIQPVLDYLEDYGYISCQSAVPSVNGRPPLPKYLVNPKLMS